MGNEISKLASQLLSQFLVNMSYSERQNFIKHNKLIMENALLFNVKLENSDSIATEVIRLLDKGDITDFLNIKPVDGFTLLDILSRVDEQSARRAQKMFTEKTQSLGGKNRAKNDPAHQALNKVAQDFIDCKFPWHKRGYTKRFVDQMVAKYPEITNRKSIERKVAELKKVYPLS